MKHEFSYYLGWALMICSFIAALLFVIFGKHSAVEFTDEIEDEIIEDEFHDNEEERKVGDSFNRND